MDNNSVNDSKPMEDCPTNNSTLQNCLKDFSKSSFIWCIAPIAARISNEILVDVLSEFEIIITLSGAELWGGLM